MNCNLYKSNSIYENKSFYDKILRCENYLKVVVLYPITF